MKCKRRHGEDVAKGWRQRHWSITKTKETQTWKHDHPTNEFDYHHVLDKENKHIVSLVASHVVKPRWSIVADWQASQHAYNIATFFGPHHKFQWHLAFKGLAHMLASYALSIPLFCFIFLFQLRGFPCSILVIILSAWPWSMRCSTVTHLWGLVNMGKCAFLMKLALAKVKIMLEVHICGLTCQSMKRVRCAYTFWMCVMWV